jgi:dTDP-4-amino-4,6-dideoxygalactose transaminase
MLALGETHYKEPTPPAAMGAFAAAAAAAHAQAALDEIAARRAGAEALLDLLAEAGVSRSWRVPLPPEAGRCGWLRLPVVAPNAASRDALLIRGRCLGVAGGYPRALPDLPALTSRFQASDVPPLTGARELAARLVTLPTHSRVGVPDRARMLAALSEPAEIKDRHANC